MVRKLNMGMIGGGTGSFIGGVHRMAANLDGHINLVCGAFSSDVVKCKATGEELYLPETRCYESYEAMIVQEQKIPIGERMDFVSIVTPNHLHFAPAKMAMQNGFDVVLDKPMTLTLAEAKELAFIATETGRRLCLTHTYTGYPMIKEARHQIANNVIGKIRKVYVRYPQGWLSTKLEDSNQKQAAWRTDPKRSGIAGSIGDIGTHAFNLVEYVTGLEVTSICAAVNIIVEGRQLDDDAAVLLKFNNNATGVLIATQVAAGEENNLTIQIHGELGGMEWQHQDSNSLVLKWLDRPAEIYRAGTPYLSDVARHNCRTPAGHPEGFIEAFANIYRNFALTLKAEQAGKTADENVKDFPGIKEGVRGMAFIENVIAAGNNKEKWTRFKI